jgi:hypothetical protein
LIKTLKYKTPGFSPPFLNLHRLTVYSVASAALGCSVIITSLVTTPARLSGATDFPAFYNAGRIARQAPARLYDRELQIRMFSDVAPLIDPQLTPLFAYTPFFSLLFAPLSVLPYPIAFLCWVLMCGGMLIAGIALVWRVADLPKRYFRNAAIIAVCFLPFYAWCLFMGQTTAFGLFTLAAAIYLENRDPPLASGFVLSLLLYKPPLLILLIPMLVITKRWSTLIGFAIGGFVLGVISLSLIGTSGVPAYIEMTRGFANKKVGLAGLTHIEVDAYSFFVNLTAGRGRPALALFIILIATVGYWLVKSWRSNPGGSWITAITWSIVLNYYVLLYDSALVILSVILLIGSLRGNVPRTLFWLLIVLFITPWFHAPMARVWGVQMMTLALISFGGYQLLILTRSASRQRADR